MTNSQQIPFYSEGFASLRFGDVLSGFALSFCIGYKPQSTAIPTNYRIDITHFQYVAVLTPCCTIQNKLGNTLVVTPLEIIKPQYYFKNSLFKQDLTLLNRPLTWLEWVGPENEGDEELRKEIYPGKQYNEFNIFVYKEHPLLEEYDIKYIGNLSARVGAYQIDFRNIFKIECKPEYDIRAFKLLQLSKQARNDLRLKMTNYFGRTPDEDLV